MPEMAEGSVRQLGMSVEWDAMDALLLRLEEMPDVDEPAIPAPPSMLLR